MCLILLVHRVVDGYPLLLAANREESYSRPTAPPQLHVGPPRVVCGTDLLAGGTWLAVNEYGLVAAVTNRPYQHAPREPRSRGLLCRDVARMCHAADALELAREELANDCYAGVNLLVADPQQAWVLSAAERISVERLEPGMHLLAAGNANDPHDARLARVRRMFGSKPAPTAEEFCRRARTICSLPAGEDGPAILLRRPGGGTVSSTILTLADKREASQFWHAPGPPDQTPYHDLSHLLHALWSAQSHKPAE
ncbi:MAG: NRDE family protein [Pirellulales bacterium]|nr:NRDE family protein [Pirellulales bacterium]